MKPSNLVIVALFAPACGRDPAACGEGAILWGDECVTDWTYRHEPADRIDVDNVSYFGSGYTELDLPEPPKSGFRLMTQEVTLDPFEERFFCQSWPLPAELRHRRIYSTVLRNTAGLHHANLYAVPFVEGMGASDYPDCNLPANDLIKNNVLTALGGSLESIDVPDVLFANTTQVVGGETFAFPDGYGIHLREDGEILLDTHLFNPTDRPLTVEVAYDFYTAPEDVLPNEVSSSVYLWLDFLLQPGVPEARTATCDWGGGELLSVMPHMHQWGTGFEASFLAEDGTEIARPYSVSGGMPQSWIQTPDEPIDTTDAVKTRFTCEWTNDTDHPMCNGVGENEMCFLFTYVSPPESRRFGVVSTDGGTYGPVEDPPCWVIDPAHPEDFPPVQEVLADAPDEVALRYLELAQLDVDAHSTCPEISPYEEGGE